MKPSLAAICIPVLGAIIVAMVGGGGILANAFQGKSNDKDREIAILTAERDAWMNKAIEAELSGRRARHSRSGSRTPDLAGHENAVEVVDVAANFAAEVRAEVRPDTFKAKPTFLGRLHRQLRLPQKK